MILIKRLTQEYLQISFLGDILDFKGLANILGLNFKTFQVTVTSILKPISEEIFTITGR